MFLNSLKDEGVTFRILVGQPYSVGRRDASLLITDDPSISRKHAVFTLSHLETNINNPKKLPILVLKDACSKYGTYVNNKKIGPEDTVLNVGDKVTFGQCENSYKVCYEPLIVTTSCIDSEEKKLIKTSIRKLGGHLISEWTKDCTHLVMKDIKVTIKAVCALVSLKPLVTINYFKDMIQCIQEQKICPNPESYIPELGEPLIDKDSASFNCKEERKVLFQHKTFICSSEKQYKKLHLSISLAGGKVILLDKDSEIKLNLLLHPDTCVMKYIDLNSQLCQQMPSHIEQIENELKRNKKRVIPESDIGLAVVYCSTEKYCNPLYDIASTLFSMSKLQSQSLSQQDIYVPDSQFSTERSAQETIKEIDKSSIEESIEKPESNVQNSPISYQKLYKKRASESVLESLAKQAKMDDVISEKDTQQPDVRSSSSPNQPKSKRIEIKQEFITPLRNEDIDTVEDIDWEDCTIPYENQTEENELISEVKIENIHQQPVEINDINKKLIEKNIRKTDDNLPVQEKISIQSVELPNGFLTTIQDMQNCPLETITIDEDLPKNLINIKMTSLCAVKKVPTCIATNNLSMPNKQVKNFKKFRKIFSTANHLPRIIGGRDLIVYTKSSSKTFDDWLSQNPDTYLSQETNDADMFDWDSNKRKRR